MSYTTGIYAPHARIVINDDIEGTPSNTILAYARKTEEFIMFCQRIHPSTTSSVSDTTVTEEKKLVSFFTSLVDLLDFKVGEKCQKVQFSRKTNIGN